MKLINKKLPNLDKKQKKKIRKLKIKFKDNLKTYQV